MAHPCHEEVRQRYRQACGYCGVSEADAGGELTVDHYRPLAHGGDDSRDNLIYACFRCNLYKTDFQPTPVDLQLGRRVLHPLLDSLPSHLCENPQTGRLEPLTETGRFHILLLRLNRPQLIEHRLQRRLAQLTTETLQLLRQENEGLHRRVALLEEYLRHLSIQRHVEGESPGATV